MSDRKIEDRGVTSQELQYIIDVNRKSMSIYNEVAQQNETIISSLDDVTNKQNEIDKNIALINQTTVENSETLKEINIKMGKIDENLFRLLVVLTTSGVGIIYTVIESIVKLIMHH